MASLSACQARTPTEDSGRVILFCTWSKQNARILGWVLASWNVQPLLDIDGSIETARKGVGDAEVVDERKIDQVVGEWNR